MAVHYFLCTLPTAAFKKLNPFQLKPSQCTYLLIDENGLFGLAAPFLERHFSELPVNSMP